MDFDPETPASPVDVGVAVVEHEGHVLVGIRPAGAPLAGLCEFPGGKAEPQESPAEAATRECFEETGLRVRVERLDSTVEHSYDHGFLRLHFFACSIEGPAAPRAPFRWLAVDELDARQFPPANARLIRRLRTDMAKPARSASRQ